MAKKYQAPRGTHDVTPSDAPAWQYLEATFARLAAQYGYSEVRTPAFEDTDLFVRSSGETSEVVSKQMYSFEDKGGRDITLKPEGTAPAMRAYLEHSLGLQGQTTRLWYATQIFRYERPQKGRYRQAHQVGLELIGSSSPAADAEVIEVTVEFYRRLGIKDLRVLLNCIGRGEARTKYGEALLAHVSGWLKDQSAEDAARARKNPLRLLDAKDDELRAALSGAPSILDFVSDESKEHFEAVQALLGEAGVGFQVASEVVRGLDYYTDTVFEVQSTALGAQNALCGGGRYDWLIKELGGPDTPSVGVAMGVERAVMVMQEQEVDVPSVRLDVFVVFDSFENMARARRLCRALRGCGLGAQCALEEEKMGRQFKAADRSGARLALVIGSSEIESGQLTMKALDTGEESSVPFAEVAKRLGAADCKDAIVEALK
ncbi:MAG TPA: histidine--tRNA ligase [Fimbriimonadaceae bacterium]|nr:histidine--tRNA ligase [Fimbriimonadaceae bacterium]